MSSAADSLSSLLSLRLADGRTVPVRIVPGAHRRFSAFTDSRRSSGPLFLVTDNHLRDLYISSTAPHAVDTSAFDDIIVLPAGEPSKTRETVAHIHDRLLERRAGRDSTVVAFGGGVVGDTAGFAAATLHRGIGLVHIPTSLLAQVDSAIGGKTGVNHPLGKNLLGAFYHPDAVVIDPEFLRTLPREERTNGMAEVIKYAVALDPALQALLAGSSDAVHTCDTEVLTTIVRRCAELKIAVVERDEREGGLRSILNFGHTVGHALERLSGYAIKHGFAVAQGMRVALRLSHALCGYPASAVDAAERLLAMYGLPVLPLPPFDELWDALSLDKKARRSEPRFSLLNADGSPALFHPVTREEVYRAAY